MKIKMKIIIRTIIIRPKTAGTWYAKTTEYGNVPVVNFNNQVLVAVILLEN